MEKKKEEAWVVVEGVSKRFGREWALKEVNMTLNRGEVCGIVGNNGSGKTVLMKCICGFFPVTAGRITVGGQVIGRDRDFPESLGAVIETPGFLPHLTGRKNMEILADLTGKAGEREILRTLCRVGLDPALKKPVSKYSLGMRQRLGIAQALMEDPKLLILDEPFNGLDKHGTADIRSILQGEREKGKTILLASHNKEDIRLLCSRVFEMDGGILREVNKDEG